MITQAHLLRFCFLHLPQCYKSITDDDDNDIKCSTDDNNDNDNVETSVLGEVGQRTPLGVVRANTSGLMR